MAVANLWLTAGAVIARCTLFDSEIDFLDFALAYTDLAVKLADAVTLQATPVGGTVARHPIRLPLRRASSENFWRGRE